MPGKLLTSTLTGKSHTRRHGLLRDSTLEFELPTFYRSSSKSPRRFTAVFPKLWVETHEWIISQFLVGHKNIFEILNKDFVNSIAHLQKKIIQ